MHDRRITRASVLSIVEQLGVRVHVQDLDPGFVAEADGAFVCGTACEVLPVRRIDDAIWSVAGNDLIKAVHEEYRAPTAGQHV